MTELVGHSLLSKVLLHLNECILLFPFLHILLHVLAKQDIHQMERKSSLVAVAKCVLDFSWPFLYSVQPETGVI